ncbi:MAG: hypothetical protein HY033_10820 [Ignavibacteriae bacterium]|nr:hypothetical protein [Ignavibacteria bacterium]MBI3365391.1 hypothetical protein [Ignavibacteriota bacterium]
MTKRLGIVPYLFAQPLFYGLKEREGPSDPFELIQELPAHLALKLRERHLDAAFLSPIDYARDYAMYSIIPRVGVASQGDSETAYVIFKESLRTLRSLAVNPASTSEIVLAHLVFVEKYGSVPTIVPFAGTIDQGLEKADAVLCVGDEVRARRNDPHKLDLVEEWDDMTELPFVHGIWVTRETALSPFELTAIIDSARLGKANLDQVSNEVDYLNQFQYDMDDHAQEGLLEFLRMAYYHGILPDVPDIRYLSLTDHAKDHTAEALN